MTKQCEMCVFAELCESMEDCENYYPATGQYGELEFRESLMTDDIYEYREAWFEYINEDDDVEVRI